MNDKNVVSSSSPGNNGNNEVDDQNVIRFVQTLMEQMHSKFQNVSDQILERIDEMSTRIDHLEKSLNDLVDNAEPYAKNPNMVCSSSKE